MRDWQRVLCRISLYPNEVQHFSKLRVGENHTIRVLPLHLACALDAPHAVVELMLELHSESASLSIQPDRKRLRKKRGLLSKTMVKYILARGKALRSTPAELSKEDLHLRQATFSQSDDGYRDEDVQQSLLSPFPAVVTPSSRDVSQQDDASALSESSATTPLPTDNAILQLSPTGSKHPMPLEEEEEEPQNSFIGESLFRVQWDLGPLFRHITEHGSLLPLHIACFYSASPEILRTVLNAYPAAALSDVVGMLPIHWVSAGWALPPLFQPIVRRPDESLEVLQQTVPDSVRIRSGSHGMTPAEYIHECMEESTVKTTCLHIVNPQKDGFCSSDDSIIFGGSDSSDDELVPESTVCINSLISDRDWETMLVAIEGDPSIASKWVYGLDEGGLSVWKRLPIHLACANKAPVGLVSLLLRLHREGGMLTDPRDGSTPLHIACQSGSSLSTIQLLVSTCPDALRVKNKTGHLPLHLAIMNAAPMDLVQTLIEADPMSTLTADADNKYPAEYAQQVYPEDHAVHGMLGVARVRRKTLLNDSYSVVSSSSVEA